MKSFKIISMGLLTGVLLLGPAAHAEKEAAKSAAKLSASFSMADTLKSLMNHQSPVEIVLHNGKTYGGMVKEVGNANVVLTKLNQKEFYDAVIKIDDISAVEVRVR